MNPSPEEPLDVQWIDSPRALSEALPELADASELAIDTEADSYYSYHVKICLLQISTRQRDFIVDPLADLDLGPLGELFSDPRRLVVFHAGANDVGLLNHQFGFRFCQLFDTMMAAQVLGLPRSGLGSLLEVRFGVAQEKSYQTSDWRVRPLTTGQIQYASQDTHYLLPLMDQLITELADKGRTEEAREEFTKLLEVSHTERVFDPESFRRVREAKSLSRVELRVLSEIYRYREEVAARRDCSPHRVFPDRILLELARRKPRQVGELKRSKGFSRWKLDREHAEIIETIRAALAMGPMPPPKRRPRNESLDGDARPLTDHQKAIFECLRDWRLRRAEEREVEPSRVATTGLLKNIARSEPDSEEALEQVEGMTPFRLGEYGEEILEVVRQTPRHSG